MAENPPQRPNLTPEEAARRIDAAGDSDVDDIDIIAADLRNHVEEFGPAEVSIGGQTYTVDSEARIPAEPEGDDPDLLVRFMERLFEREPALRQHFIKEVMFEFARFVGDKEDTLALIDEYLGSDAEPELGS